MPGLWARRLAEDEVVERDVVQPEMLEPVVARCIHKADKADGPMPMLMAISRDGLVAREDRLDDETSADVLLIFPKMSG